MDVNSNVILFIWICLLGLNLAEVILRGEWKENFGWHVTCSWQTLPNDSVLSVRMYKNDVQFIVYKPGYDGNEKESEKYAQTSASFEMNWRCLSNDSRQGRCVAKWEPHYEVSEDTYRCEVSGESPKFRWEEQSYTIFAPPSAAIMKQVDFGSNENHDQRPAVNCTSSGLPAPKLIWTINGQKVPEDFTLTVWNSTTKLWHSWSSFNPQDSNARVVCTPVAITKSGRMVMGSSALWASPNNSKSLGAEKYYVLVFSVLALLFR